MKKRDVTVVPPASRRHRRAGGTPAVQSTPRGSIMIVAMGVIIVLTGLVLVYAQEMRIEAQAASSRASQLQAAGLARAGLAYAANHLLDNHDPLSLDSEMDCEARQVGDGYFWLLRPNPTDEKQYAFGLVDEASKLNINTATYDQLMALPNMTTDLAGSIIDWRDADDNINQNGGAENEFYLAMPEPYYCKNSNFETPEEILLVKGSTTDLLFCVDANHNGVVDASEGGAVASSTLTSLNGQSSCGIMKYLTVYSLDTNTDANGKARININDPNSQNLLRSLEKLLGKAKADAMAANLRRRPFLSVFDFYYKSGMALDDFKKICDKLTTSAAKTIPGLININTAPKEVLKCLPGLLDADADALVQGRASGGTDSGSIAWVLNILPKEKAVPIGNYITVKTSRFSADIVGVSGDGRGLKRVKCVWDVRGASPKLLYYRDLSHLGWPLDQSVLDGLRNGQGAASTNSSDLGGLNSAKLNANSSSAGSSTPKLGGSK